MVKKSNRAVNGILAWDFFAESLGFTVDGGHGAKGGWLGCAMSLIIVGILAVYGF
jgi:hypothetical protein